MTDTHRTHTPADAPKIDTNRDPVRLCDVLAELLPELAKNMHRRLPVGVTLSIELDKNYGTDLGTLRALVAAADGYSDDDEVGVDASSGVPVLRIDAGEAA